VLAGVFGWGLASTRAIPATVASAMSAAHCVERNVQGETNMIKWY
jgi:hypothetical protein